MSDDDGDEDDLVEIQVPNPEIKPAARFRVLADRRTGRCDQPAGFPQKYHILLLQGERSDYIAGFGQCCLLGYMNNNKVTSKGCILVNSQIERTLDLQFLSKDLTLYVHPTTAPLNPALDGFVRATLTVKQVKDIN